MKKTEENGNVSEEDVMEEFSPASLPEGYDDSDEDVDMEEADEEKDDDEELSDDEEEVSASDDEQQEYQQDDEEGGENQVDVSEFSVDKKQVSRLSKEKTPMAFWCPHFKNRYWKRTKKKKKEKKRKEMKWRKGGWKKKIINKIIIK